MANKLYCIAVKSEKQLDARALDQVDIIILCPEEYGVKSVERFLQQVVIYKPQNADKNNAAQIYMDMPVAAMSRDIAVIREILENNGIRERLAGIVANNVYALRLAEEYGLEAFKGAGMNTLNDNFCDFKNIMLSPEINEAGYRLFKDWDKKNYFLCVYGRPVLMTLAHCPYQVNGYGCGRCEGTKLQYKDELNNVMDIRRVRLANCYFELLNAVPLNLLKHKNKIKPHFCFDMRETARDDILKTIKSFKEPGNKELEGNYTAGLYFKNVK